METNNDGECIGPYAKVRIFIDITKPLEKMVLHEGFVQITKNLGESRKR